jgi:hypothetical protein
MSEYGNFVNDQVRNLGNFIEVPSRLDPASGNLLMNL